MIRGEMINAAIKAAYQKAGEEMQGTKDRDVQKEMAQEVAEVIGRLIDLGRVDVSGLGAEQTP